MIIFLDLYSILISMTLGTLDTILLLMTGLLSVIMAWLLIRNYKKTKKLSHICWATSLSVLFVSGVLIIFLGFEVLEEPIIPVIAAIIPIGMALGLLFEIWENTIGIIYLSYSLVVILLLLVARLDIILGSWSTILIMATHIPSGLIIVGLPIYYASKIDDDKSYYYFSIGGILISFGGILLAFVKLSEPLFGVFDQGLIYGILPLLLLIVGVFFILGISKPKDWRVEIPYLS